MASPVMPVVHHEIGVAQLASRAEVEHLRRRAPIEHDGRVAQRAVSDSDRDAADDIVDDLVPDQDAQRVGARVPANLQSDHGIIGAEFPILGSGLEKRLVDGRDTVLRRASR
jgi:hypothetical protein